MPAATGATDVPVTLPPGRERLLTSPACTGKTPRSMTIGIEGVAPGRNIELAPTLTGYRSDSRDDLATDPLERGDPHSELGLTAKWGITPNLIANAAFNPDFSQVEADAAQLDINTRFALFFLSHGSAVDRLLFWGAYGRTARSTPEELEDLRVRLVARIPWAFKDLVRRRARKRQRTGIPVERHGFHGRVFGPIDPLLLDDAIARHRAEAEHRDARRDQAPQDHALEVESDEDE